MGATATVAACGDGDGYGRGPHWCMLFPMVRFALFALIVAGCDSGLGSRSDGGLRRDGGAMDAGVGLDAPGLDAPGLDAPGIDSPPAPDTPAAMPDTPPPAVDAWTPVHPFGPCGCEVCPCPPPPAGCDFPEGVPDEDFTGADALPTLVDEVNAAMVAVTGCSIGSACPTGFSADHAGAQMFFDLVNAELRSRGLCAGQHRSGETDEIAVSRNCRAVWEGYHVFAYGGATVVWARNPSAPCGGSACPGLGGGSFRGIWWVPTSYCP